MRSQLGELGRLLREYKDVHGRYPTNDEGLAVLDNFGARFELTFYHDPDNPPDRLRYRVPYWLHHSEHMIDGYRGEYGRAPQSVEDLKQSWAWQALNQHDEYNRDRRLEPVPMEVAFGGGGSLFFFSPAGVLSPWLVPYVYENRRGMDRGAFRSSRVERDKKGRYSIQVDEGVYVYSIGGQLHAERKDRARWAPHAYRLAGCGLVLISAVLVVVLIRRSKKLALVGGVAMLVSAGAMVTREMKAYDMTCYLPSTPAPFSYRDSRVVARQRKLLDSFHKRGVIGDETYAKALSALERGPMTGEPDQ